ncbi:ImmA/IrrE family metallo-endopeptidase [Sandaracinobacter neustonicus]|uniref:ImmA/IrrE family metallo-endopeptidase n=1 Tax=Sandaracinobacter neustonicus TaxID=1715348 RepID=A0A501XJ22_9SPHN|nr:ImmA/IrrE family metallo-endopeptidase [Sandaracinobacter neustonicus]TPE60546.1 ImmA/IrrE family metallo-endopeptidase [Sandaracinobacter neustonicus]
MFDPRAIAAYAVAQGKKAADVVKRALGKVLGILDAYEEVIHIDDSVLETRQRFLKLHETGHFELPHQRKIFRFFEDSEEELNPSIVDKFEREANNFARYAIFNGNAYAERAADFPLAFSSVKKMKSVFNVSLYAGLREYARTHRHVCIAMAVEKPALCPQNGWSAEIRRVETSLEFERQFGRPQLSVITTNHPFWRLVPFGKATKPTKVWLTNLNGEQQEFVGEALDTTYNILIFACPTALFKS